jgi:hypothetical protein
MTPQFWSVLHVLSVILLGGFTFAMIAKPDPATRKRWLMLTGILSLVALVAGFALWGKVYQMQVQGWIIAKLVIWLFLSAAGGLAYRLAGLRSVLFSATIVLLALAVYLVYFRPGV